MKKKKYIIAIALFLILAITTVLLLTNIEDESVKAYDFREGFLITPDLEYEFGFDINSSFTINTKDEYTLEEMNERFFIEGYTSYNLEQISNTQFKVILNESLSYDSVYILGIRQNEMIMATFAYQSVSKFRIAGYLPNTQSTNVPINTGIEVYFSNSDISNFENSFSIYPEVNGKFEAHDNAYVFVPDNDLDYKTVYTITLEGGKIENSDGQVIDEETVFSFETVAKEDEYVEYKYKGYVNFDKLMYEYNSIDAISVPYYMDMPINNSDVNLLSSIYQFENGSKMVEYIQELLEKPYWSRYNNDENMIDTSKLNKVLSFNNVVNYDNKINQFQLDIPNNLEKGMYLLKMTWEHGETFVVLQVTDLAAYILEDDENTYVWVHDLITKDYSSSNVNGTTTNSEGLAIVNNDLINDGIIKITDASNETYIFKNPFYYNAYDNYWDILTTDRTLYKPEDTVNFFGFISKREGQLTDQKVTVEINRGYYYYYFDYAKRGGCIIPPYPMEDTPLISFETTLEDCFYEGDILLPSLAEGHYTITIKYDGEQIANKYFNVEQYVKPSMKIEIIANKKAVFADEEIEYSVHTSFFEGTPVAGLEVTYFINYENDYIENQAISDINGNISFKYTPEYVNGANGIKTVYVGVRAKLPEVGELVSNSYIKVYMNDIEYTYETDIENNSIILKGNVYNFIPNYETGLRENTGPYTFEDVKLKLYKHTLVKRETGTYYDYINKETVKQYTYDVVDKLIQSKNITTDMNGDFNTLLPYTDEDRTWYTIDIEIMDKNNRKVNKTAYARETYDYTPYYYNDYMIELNKDTYSIDDDVIAKFKRGEEEVKAIKYMYVISQNGIKKVIISDTNQVDFKYIEEYLPSATIQVIAFDGNSYIASYQDNMVFNFEDRQLNIEITTDKDDYRPGENAIIKVRVTDKDNNPIKAKVLISAVDEALLQLRDMDIDFLNELYGYVGSGIKNTYGTHKEGMNIFYDYYYGGGRGYDDVMVTEAMGMEKSSMPMPSANEASVEIRSDFKDTATFMSITTDEDGLGVATFKMPDNITSWRIFSNAINSNFYAGGNFTNVNTTLPFFINVVTSDMFLIGDKAYVGISSYGDQVDLFEDVEYKVYLKSDPVNYIIAKGDVYERVNVLLPEFKMGSDSIIVEAYTEQYSDGIEMNISVTDSYNKMQVTKKYQVTNNMVLQGGTNYNTTLVFADMEYLDYISKVFNLSYYSSERLELLLARDKATEILNNYLDDSTWVNQKDDIDYKKYQQGDGGIAILPYAKSDIKITVDNYQLLNEKIDSSMVLSYLYQYLNDNGSDAYVLYGLSQFNQPILLELNRTNQILNLDVEQLIYLALAYYNIGDEYMANDIYENRISPKIINVEPYSFINEGNDDYSLYITSKVAYLAKLLNKDEAKGLYQYSIDNYSKEYVTNNFIALYLEKQLDGKKEKDNAFTYEYMGITKDVTFENGKMFKYELPSKNLDQFKILNVKGEIGLLITYEDKLDIIEVNNQDVISINKKYYDAITNKEKTIFNTGDIIKIEIEVVEGKNFIDTTYEITDILPSGLRAIEKPYQYLGKDYEHSYVRASGQITKAIISKYFIERDNMIVYYARVINQGEYNIAGTYIKLLKSNEVVYQDNDTKLVIGE